MTRCTSPLCRRTRGRETGKEPLVAGQPLPAVFFEGLTHDVEERHAGLRLELFEGVRVDEGRGQVNVSVLDWSVEVYHLCSSSSNSREEKRTLENQDEGSSIKNSAELYGCA